MSSGKSTLLHELRIYYEGLSEEKKANFNIEDFLKNFKVSSKKSTKRSISGYMMIQPDQ